MAAESVSASMVRSWHLGDAIKKAAQAALCMCSPWEEMKELM